MKACGAGGQAVRDVTDVPRGHTSQELAVLPMLMGSPRAGRAPHADGFPKARPENSGTDFFSLWAGWGDSSMNKSCPRAWRCTGSLLMELGDQALQGFPTARVLSLPCPPIFVDSLHRWLSCQY